MSFKELKKASASSFDKLNQELSKLNSTTEKRNDDRFWQPAVDPAGNGYAVIRFLPAPDGEDVPFIRVWDHGFQGPGGWYIENSLTTLGETDPVSELNGKLWNSGVESDKEIARKQKRRLSYYSNIYVVKDPANPENEGKVFIYKYGKKIFDKIKDLMNPAFEDETPINPFDLWTGANFKLKIRKVEGYRNYDKSEFDAAGPLFDDDEKLEAVYNSEHSLQAFLDRKNFKSYDELKARLDKVLGNTAKPAEKSNLREDSAPTHKEVEQKTSKAAAPVVDDDDDDLDFSSLFGDDD